MCDMNDGDEDDGMRNDGDTEKDDDDVDDRMLTRAGLMRRGNGEETAIRENGIHHLQCGVI